MANTAHEVVSSESESLILVDEDDNAIGSLSKADCHDGEGILHRAFSLFVFNSAGELLLQQRSADKRLWPLYWSNSCCSHPRVGETLEEALSRRAAEELGLACRPEYVYRFAYHARYGDEGSERELCSVFLAKSDEPVDANPYEIEATRFVAADALDAALQAQSEHYTPWFRMEWERLRGEYCEQLEPYIAR